MIKFIFTLLFNNLMLNLFITTLFLFDVISFNFLLYINVLFLLLSILYNLDLISYKEKKSNKKRYKKTL